MTLQETVSPSNGRLNRCTVSSCGRPKDDKRAGPCCICVANERAVPRGPHIVTHKATGVSDWCGGPGACQVCDYESPSPPGR